MVEGPRGSPKNAAIAERAAQVGVHRKFDCGQVHDRADRGFVVCGSIVVVAFEAARAACGFVVDEFAVGEITLLVLKVVVEPLMASTTIIRPQIKSTPFIHRCIVPARIIQYLP